MDQPWLQSSHRMWNASKYEWAVVSLHRTERPWRGQAETPVSPEVVQYDPKCYLCPGNMRAEGALTPQYTNTYIFFENDFAALKPDLHYSALDEQALDF